MIAATWSYYFYLKPPLSPPLPLVGGRLPATRWWGRGWRTTTPWPRSPSCPAAGSAPPPSLAPVHEATTFPLDFLRPGRVCGWVIRLLYERVLLFGARAEVLAVAFGCIQSRRFSPKI